MKNTPRTKRTKTHAECRSNPGSIWIGDIEGVDLERMRCAECIADSDEDAE